MIEKNKWRPCLLLFLDYWTSLSLENFAYHWSDKNEMIDTDKSCTSGNGARTPFSSYSMLV